MAQREEPSPYYAWLRPGPVLAASLVYSLALIAPLQVGSNSERGASISGVTFFLLLWIGQAFGYYLLPIRLGAFLLFASGTAYIIGEQGFFDTHSLGAPILIFVAAWGTLELGARIPDRWNMVAPTLTVLSPFVIAPIEGAFYDHQAAAFLRTVPDQIDRDVMPKIFKRAPAVHWTIEGWFLRGTFPGGMVFAHGLSYHGMSFERVHRFNLDLTVFPKDKTDDDEITLRKAGVKDDCLQFDRFPEKSPYLMFVTSDAKGNPVLKTWVTYRKGKFKLAGEQ